MVGLCEASMVRDQHGGMAYSVSISVMAGSLVRLCDHADDIGGHGAVAKRRFSVDLRLVGRRSTDVFAGIEMTVARYTETF